MDYILYMSNVPGPANTNLINRNHHEVNEPVAWWVLGLPTVVALLVLCVSPNFRTAAPAAGQSVPMRLAPLGSDFLQEYVGGVVAGSDQRQRLYEPAYVQARQHDAQRLRHRT